MKAKETILLDHGSGGRASQELIKNIFLPQLANPVGDPDVIVQAMTAARRGVGPAT